ncbi:MAG TPA: ribosomal-protein-alanine N-acetyltransferase [Lachnoclostridium sp.]|jgi:ribosomal-protein-alanine N-acetyltransferase|uniref:ribosomal protein S18-alanine N-acetyltransferase n=1 Tax=Lacrimispora sp. TaxID=2719234 RepID=UPI000EE0D4BA|nr:ribosomal protein S18-alanine N-acetyltransferase [Lacrimispora sp.]HCD43808.1 ribosomal-protein-alanine N-acetyltransferase [Lachnoclostridium sp.]
MVHEMRQSDVFGVAEIERLCFSDPWSLKSVKEGLESSLDTWLVLEEEGQVLGYCVFRIIAGEGELLRIAVLPAYRGRGLSKKLMDRLVESSRENGVKSLSLEVRESNKRARNLYRSYGFEEETIRKNYYLNPFENAIIMWNRRI